MGIAYHRGVNSLELKPYTMKRTRFFFLAPDPLVRDLSLILAASLLMSIVFFIAGYMVFVALATQ